MTEKPEDALLEYNRRLTQHLQEQAERWLEVAKMWEDVANQWREVERQSKLATRILVWMLLGAALLMLTVLIVSTKLVVHT